MFKYNLKDEIKLVFDFQQRVRRIYSTVQYTTVRFMILYCYLVYIVHGQTGCLSPILSYPRKMRKLNLYNPTLENLPVPLIICEVFNIIL